MMPCNDDGWIAMMVMLRTLFFSVKHAPIIEHCIALVRKWRIVNKKVERKNVKV